MFNRRSHGVGSGTRIDKLFVSPCRGSNPADPNADRRVNFASVAAAASTSPRDGKKADGRSGKGDKCT